MCRCVLRPENIYVSEALARAYNLHVHDFFFVGTFGGLAPQYQKAGYASGTKKERKEDKRKERS